MLRAVAPVHLAVAALLTAVTGVDAQGNRPPVPPGRDPGGVAIALITTGIDYTLPDVARGLARDGEGELVGFDLVDSDNRPFGDGRAQTPPHWGGDGTKLAADILSSASDVRLVPVRVDPGRSATLARAVAFIAHTPARVTVVPMWSVSKENWQPFRDAAVRAPQILFVVAAGDDGKDIDKEPVYPAALGLPNVLVVTAAHTSGAAAVGARLPETANWGAKTVDAVALAPSSALAAGTAAKAAAILGAQNSGLSGANLKQRLLQLAVLQREGETPQRTRTLAILVPAKLKPARGVREPADRIRDKARIPERIQGPGRGERAGDSKAR